MDINIIAPGHPNQGKMQEYYTSKLRSLYGKLDFIVSIDARVKQDEYGDYEVSLLLNPDKGAELYARDSNMREEYALKGAVKKIKGQLEKHRSIHFGSVRTK